MFNLFYYNFKMLYTLFFRFLSQVSPVNYVEYHIEYDIELGFKKFSTQEELDKLV